MVGGRAARSQREAQGEASEEKQPSLGSQAPVPRPWPFIASHWAVIHHHTALIGGRWHGATPVSQLRAATFFPQGVLLALLLWGSWADGQPLGPPLPASRETRASSSFRVSRQACPLLGRGPSYLL